MDLKIGSNVFRNTNGILVIQGKAQIVLELRAEQHQLLLTMDLYDPEGKQLAHLRRNAWGFNRDDVYTFSTGPDSVSLFAPSPWLKIVLTETGQPVFDANMEGHDTIVVRDGRFYTHKGQFVEISSHYCRTAGLTTMFGDVADLRGGPINIGE